MRRAILPATLLLPVLGCGNRSAGAPNPTAYRWPDTFAYRVELGSGASRTLRFQVHDAQFLVATDSLAGQLAPAETDTVSFFVSLGRRGELARLQLACDPTVPSCAAELPSRLATLLRRLIPRLPLWEAPRGGSWNDTLQLDDAARPGGLRGELITRYTGRGDTVVGGHGYWVLAWRSERVAGLPGAATGAVRLEGMSLVDKDRLLPVFSSWSEPGAGDSLAGGRARLAGSAFDSLRSGGGSR